MDYHIERCYEPSGNFSANKHYKTSGAKASEVFYSVPVCTARSYTQNSGLQSTIVYPVFWFTKHDRISNILGCTVLSYIRNSGAQTYKFSWYSIELVCQCVRVTERQYASAPECLVCRHTHSNLSIGVNSGKRCN